MTQLLLCTFHTQALRVAIEHNPIEINAQIFKVRFVHAVATLCSQRVSDGEAFTFGSAYWLKYNARQYCCRRIV